MTGARDDPVEVLAVSGYRPDTVGAGRYRGGMGRSNGFVPVQAAKVDHAVVVADDVTIDTAATTAARRMKEDPVVPGTSRKTAGSLIIAGAHVWRGADEGFEQRDLAIVDGLVAAHPLPNSRVVDCSGTWVLPGLIDAHFHAYASSMDGLENERGSLSYTAINGAVRLEKSLRRGFTTVRDVAGGDIGLARAVEAGLLESPRYHFTGPALSQTGGHGDPRSQHVDVCFSH